MVNSNWVKLKDVCDTTSGGTPSRDVSDYYGGDIPWVKSGELLDGWITDTEEKITKAGLSNSSAKLFPAGTLLIALYGATVGRLGILGLDATTNQAVCGITPNDQLDRDFLFYYLLKQREKLIGSRTGGAQPNISQEIIRELDIPLPPLTEQKRIASLLARADRLRTLRRTAHELGDALLQSVFLEMFGKVRGKTKEVLLGEIADIASGVTKGQNYNGRETIEVPYLRVANVQDGYLDLSVIKTIQALPSEIEELRLKPGDVVMTEGGDFDKLGRGAIWRGEIENCIHQNHIFRVRLDTSKVTPEFFENYLLSPKAKDYFLMASKQTTNLASINMTQLKQMPVPLYPLSLQEEFAGVVARVESLRGRMGESTRQVEGLFESLLAESFGGEKL